MAECVPSIVKQAVMVIALNGGTIDDTELGVILDVPRRVARALIEELEMRGLIVHKAEAEQPQAGLIVPSAQQ